jgi:hypothetical protein
VLSFLKTILLLAIGILLGSYMLPGIFRPIQPEVRSGELWRDKFKSITETDIAEYYRLKTLEERYKKADEILAKIMMIFMADLGIRVSDETLAQAKNRLKPSVNPATPAPSLPSNAPAPRDEKSAAVEKAPVENWISAEKLRENVRSEREATDFLEKVKIDNLDESIKSSSFFTNQTETLDVLRGNFYGSGDVTIANKARHWEIEMYFHATMVNGVLRGATSSKLSEDGKVFSNQKDTGQIRHLREFTSGSEAVLVKVAPTTYFQIYYIKAMDSLIGNIYRRRSEDESFVYVGKLSLRRG